MLVVVRGVKTQRWRPRGDGPHGASGDGFRFVPTGPPYTSGFGDQIVDDLLARMRHDGCGGRPQFVELLTGIPAASRPVRRIVLVERDGR
jgi:hypothetical protein